MVTFFLLHFNLPFIFWLQAIANACRVPATVDSGLTESEVSDECEKQFDEDQELEQLINGQICFKIYPFAIGIDFLLISTSINAVNFILFCQSCSNCFADTDMSTAERKIILSGSFNPLHDGHLKLLEVAARYINNILEALFLKCLITLESSHRPVTF